MIFNKFIQLHDHHQIQYLGYCHKKKSFFVHFLLLLTENFSPKQTLIFFLIDLF